MSSNKGSTVNSIKKTNQKYKQLTQHEHVLKKPNMYIGGIEPEEETDYIYDPETKNLIHKTFINVPGLIKIISEIIENATDQTEEAGNNCDTIKMTVKDNKISVFNNGTGITVNKMLNKEGKLVDTIEALFSDMLTSSHYDDDIEEQSIGTNGIGAKATNIYSTYFNIENVWCGVKEDDPKKQKKTYKYVQTFTNNMYDKTKSEITVEPNTSKPYTQITFIPDYKRFGLEGLSEDLINLLHKKAIDISICTKPNVKVYFNDEEIKVKTLEDYIKLYYPNITPDKVVIAQLNKNWKIGFVYQDNSEFRQVSFVNNAYTSKGGNHVKYISNIIVNYIKEILKKKYKNELKPAYINSIKNYMTLFVVSNIDRKKAHFDGQAKNELLSNIPKNSVSIPENVLKQIVNTGIVESIINFIEAKSMAELKKTDGKKTRDVDIDKYKKALKAGGKESYKCRLIIVEGDSAATFASMGREIIGCDYYGIFPIRGKLLNVKNAKEKKILENKEISNIKKILGLKQGKVYTKDNINELRYGGIIILTDQDLDGYHIKGLVINFIHTFWRELCMIDGFFQTLQTPILKARHGKETKVFYNTSDYDNWAKSIGVAINNWNIKYYKGLGTHTDPEKKECFMDFEKKLINFVWENELSTGITSDEIQEYNKNLDNIDKSELSENSESINSENNIEDNSENKTVAITTKKTGGKKKLTKKQQKHFIENMTKSDESILLAFTDINVNKRKEWLNHYDKDDVYVPKDQKITYSDFINKELIHFSNDDNNRSIPSIYDGLKPSQRKILYTALATNLTSEIKVAQFAPKVSEKTGYLHGEVSLEGAIVNMAQDYPCSNNMNLLMPNGSFGSREKAGNDAAATRYIFTELSKITKLIFRPEDNILLKYIIEEGKQIEPENYYPIIPMCLVNGAKGIGTGYSTDIPCFNPYDIIDNLICMIEDRDDEMVDLIPWYRGFTGRIERKNIDTFICHGIYSASGNSVHITEIPVQSGIEAFIQNIKKKEYINSVNDSSKPNKVDFEVFIEPGFLQQMIKDENDTETNIIEQELGLVSKIKTTNLTLYDANNNLTRYDTAQDILTEFYNNRLQKYKERRELYIRILSNNIEILKEKMRFIQDVMNNVIIISRRKKDDIVQDLIKHGYKKMSTDINAVDEDLVNDQDENNDKQLKVNYKSYKYIFELGLFSLTKEKLEALQKQIDEKQTEYDRYINITEKDLWREELMELRNAYDKEMIEWNENQKSLVDGTTKKKTRRSVKKNVDNSDKKLTTITINDNGKIISKENNTTKKTSNKTGDKNTSGKSDKKVVNKKVVMKPVIKVVKIK